MPETATVHRTTGAFIGIEEDYLARTSTITKGDGTNDTITTEQLPDGDSLLTLEEVCAGAVSMDPLYPADDESE